MGGWPAVGPRLTGEQQHGMATRSAALPSGKGNPIGIAPRLPGWTIWMCRVLLLVVCFRGLGSGVQAQQPPGVTLPTPFPPPGAVMPPDVALPPAPPVPSETEAYQKLQQEVLKLTQNVTTALEKKYGFCITDGYVFPIPSFDHCFNSLLLRLTCSRDR